MDLTKAFDFLNHDLLLQSSIQMISNMMHWNLFKIQHLVMGRDNTRGCRRLCFCSPYYSCYISCLCQWSVLLKYVIVLMILFFMFAIENFREWWNISLFPTNLYFGEDVWKTSWRRFQHKNLSPFKTSGRRLTKTSSRRDIFKTSCKTRNCYASLWQKQTTVLWSH